MEETTTIQLNLPKDVDYKVNLSLAYDRLHGSKLAKRDKIISLIREGLKHEKRNSEKP